VRKSLVFLFILINSYLLQGKEYIALSYGTGIVNRTALLIDTNTILYDDVKTHSVFKLNALTGKSEKILQEENSIYEFAVFRDTIVCLLGSHSGIRAKKVSLENGTTYQTFEHKFKEIPCYPQIADWGSFALISDSLTRVWMLFKDSLLLNRNDLFVSKYSNVAKNIRTGQYWVIASFDNRIAGILAVGQKAFDFFPMDTALRQIYLSVYSAIILKNEKGYISVPSGKKTKIYSFDFDLPKCIKSIYTFEKKVSLCDADSSRILLRDNEKFYIISIPLSKK
jgi:hypothetical protein